MKNDFLSRKVMRIGTILILAGAMLSLACPRGRGIASEKALPSDEGTANQVAIDEKARLTMNIQSEPAQKRLLIKKIHVPGRIAKDEELYLVQQEYLSVHSLGEDLERSARLKLELLGFSNQMISHLVHNGEADESLILPSTHRAWLFADIYEKDLSLVKPGYRVSITFNAYPGGAFSGTIQAIERKLDPQTRSSKARILIEHPMIRLSLGLYADVEIAIPLGKKLSVPVSALIDTGKRQLLYVETTRNQYEPRTVKTGNETDEYVEVVGGVAEGELVATQGNFLLDSQATLGGGQALLYGAAEQVGEKTKPAVHQH